MFYGYLPRRNEELDVFLARVAELGQECLHLPVGLDALL